jgi:DmsE family decaheme c-type cytochrome
VTPIDALKTLTRAALTACCLAVGLFALAPDGVGAAEQDAAAGPQGYVGSDTCLTCHESQSVHGTAHGNEKLPGSPAAAQGCESCHGPGARHVEDDEKGHMRKFGEMAPREVTDTCLTCHNRSEHAMWEGSAHSARNLGCATCHSVHSFTSEKGQLVKANQMEVCASCHKSQVQKQLRSAHMPVREGKMTCTSCHNPHGSVTPALLKEPSLNDTCYTCHAEKRGPFLFEHAPVVESCANCHEPHGSNHEKMLKVAKPRLCQQCHIESRHPTNPYGRDTASLKFVMGRQCASCHVNVHGSNHPSGFNFTR